ncbi:NmrA family NAD(P)-binding protein [uncultured Williamsia sp.]|uniref:NmrA family NAD(P)-binding protein n=1 Tax=uncultured Williamsia sp. TaxID=259311 RepID=UPI00260EDB3B|nr:NmrA family NAD(P)-binding protein [uncultured Williamsia sp.]
MPTPQLPVAVIGATGTVGSRLTRQLHGRGVPVRAASRSGTHHFDWTDDATFRPLVEGASAVYLLPPVGSAAPADPMGRLVRVALESGVRRFVLQSASVIDRGDPGLGEVHDLIASETPEWAVIRPSWFMQNLEPGHYLGDHLAAHDSLPTSVDDGRVAFVDAEDIAAVAAHALVDTTAHQAEHLVTGPEALTYDDVAAALSDVTGRTIVHERVTVDRVEQLMLAAGMPSDFVPFLAGLENHLRVGGEGTVSDAVATVTGRPARSLREYLTANAAIWRRAA